jgi:hypothetical protein
MQVRIAFAIVALSSLGIGAAQNQSDIAYLQNGVRETAPTSNSGSLIVFGEQAFPVLSSRSGWVGTEPAIAAARFGEGRMVVLASATVLEPDVLKVADTGRMLSNMLHWAGGEKETPKIGIYHVPGLARRLKTFDGAALEARDIELSDRNQVDVVVILSRMVDAKDVAPLQEYVRQGGGLVTGGVYFMIEQAFAGMDLATEIPVTRLTAPAGIVWARSQVTPTSPQGFRAETPSELSHAGRALDAFEAGEAGKRILTDRDERARSPARSTATAASRGRSPDAMGDRRG